MGLESKFIHIIESNFNHSKCIHIYIYYTWYYTWHNIHDFIHRSLYVYNYLHFPASPTFFCFLFTKNRIPRSFWGLHRVHVPRAGEAICPGHCGKFQLFHFWLRVWYFSIRSGSVGSMGRWVDDLTRKWIHVAGFSNIHVYVACSHNKDSLHL